MKQVEQVAVRNWWRPKWKHKIHLKYSPNYELSVLHVTKLAYVMVSMLISD